jgi:signal transduction histidine kinase/CheY-like chemotaxis protein
VHALLFGNRLFDVVSIPVKVGANVVGALTFGVEIGATVAEEFKQLTHMEIVFLVNDRVTLTTLQKEGLQRDLREHFLDTELPKKPRVRELSLGGEHFVGLGAPFTAMGDGEPAYLLLSSYEQSLAALHATQRMLALCSLVAIALGTGVVFLLVRKVTQPLRALRDSAEAVGHGDFSRRVEVASRDECGELANVFNEMTDKLKVSRTQLERTVDTLKTTQAQLVQSEKLSAIGEFVAGVAHELNNPLTSVIGFAELLQNADVNDRHKHFLGLIMISAHRCHKIVQSLLSFARQHKPERKLVQLREVIESAMSILQYQLRTNNVEVQTQFAADSPRVMGDPHQLQQVFINILNNARQAIEAYRPRGLVRITSEVHNATVRVTFQDDGPGIETDNISRIFNPFFTTKEIGQGTGLGLSLSYGIIKEHGGNISVQSKPGEGATFIIELPVAQESDGHAKKAEDRNTTVFDGRGKKVLVVDDEELVLNLVSESLNPTGCDLAVAADGESALRQLRETRFDLTICDWKMPGVNGQQVYEALRMLDRDAASRFIFMTGDVMSSNVQTFLEQTGVTCLSKPFSIDHLRSVVGKVLKAA